MNKETKTDIGVLLQEAAARGDDVMVATCRRALDDDAEAHAECVEIIREARREALHRCELWVEAYPQAVAQRNRKELDT